MRTLLKNAAVINVFTGEKEKADVLIEDGLIIGVGGYGDEKADTVRDLTGKYICPGFIDGHIHIESTMLLPSELARVCVPHGTTAIVADPHEIANVCGTKGIRFMLEASEGIPLSVYVMLPSCVPASDFDEAGAVLGAEELEPFYAHPRVLGLAEVMNYPGVIARDPKVMDKVVSALAKGRYATLIISAALTVVPALDSLNIYIFGKESFMETVFDFFPGRILGAINEWQYVDMLYIFGVAVPTEYLLIPAAVIFGAGMSVICFFRYRDRQPAN